jgi:hypothetical protein
MPSKPKPPPPRPPRPPAPPRFFSAAIERDDHKQRAIGITDILQWLIEPRRCPGGSPGDSGDCASREAAFARVISAFTESLANSATLLVAPTGAGKSTAMRAALSSVSGLKIPGLLIPGLSTTCGKRCREVPGSPSKDVSLKR